MLPQIIIAIVFLNIMASVFTIGMFKSKDDKPELTRIFRIGIFFYFAAMAISGASALEPNGINLKEYAILGSVMCGHIITIFITWFQLRKEIVLVSAKI